ncbi:MAG: PLDc N-terminal domain-containing protein [Reichenbachiella sp.]|uniref:PLDc N-terminal domain-containing protein n=1 Tax=Reichenbachiella sp. TaxID=2184521 RepID=UPI0032661E79
MMDTYSIFYLIGVISAIWVIYEVLTKQKSMSMGSKVIWIICALLFSIITALVYYFTKKK